MDSHPAGDPHPGPPSPQLARLHLVLRAHLPHRDWAWLGIRRRCRVCGQRFPCPPRRRALEHLDQTG